MVFVSAKTGAGIGELLDVIVKLLPNPTEGNPPSYTVTKAGNGGDTELQPVPDPGKHVLAHVFKVEIDPYIGSLAVFRVHQGRMTAGMQLYVGEGRKPIKAGHLYLLRGKTQTEVHEAIPGDICAIAKVDEIQFDHVLHDSAEDAHMHARAARAADAGVRPRGAAEEARRRAEGVRRAAQDPAPRTRASRSSTTRRPTRP